MKTRQEYIKSIQAAFDNFSKVQDQYGEFGAGDTEPDYAFQHAIHDSLDHGYRTVPRTIDGWQLCRGPGAGVAARALYEAAEKVSYAIWEATEEDDSDENCAAISDFVHSKLWRICRRASNSMNCN